MFWGRVVRSFLLIGGIGGAVALAVSYTQPRPAERPPVPHRDSAAALCRDAIQHGLRPPYTVTITSQRQTGQAMRIGGRATLATGRQAEFYCQMRSADGRWAVESAKLTAS